MKLKTKLALYATLLIVAAIAICCMLILSFAREQMVKSVTSSALTDTTNLCNTFSRSVYAELPKQDMVMRAYMLYQFRNTAGSSEFTLFSDEEYLSNNAGFDAVALIGNGYTTESGIKYKIVQTDGVEYIIASYNVEIESNFYSITLVRNVSDTFAGMRELTLKCFLIGLIIMIASIAFMWLIVSKSLKPIGILRKNASMVANGEYQNRIKIVGKDELAELADDFNTMAEAVENNIHELNKKSERQQMFINDLSHELKTPVTSILLNSETLLKRKVSPETQTHSLERIYDQGKWLERLSQKLMTLVLLQDEIELQEESVGKLLYAVKATTEDALKERNMELYINCAINTLFMDFDLMRSVLVNLVENARKASAEGQTIEIHAYGNIIEVKDYGKGIHADEITRITEPFYMVDRSRSKKHGGAGLGLALVQQITKAHGAQLFIESKLNVGTTMRLTFNKD